MTRSKSKEEKRQARMRKRERLSTQKAILPQTPEGVSMIEVIPNSSTCCCGEKLNHKFKHNPNPSKCKLCRAGFMRKPGFLDYKLVATLHPSGEVIEGENKKFL